MGKDLTGQTEPLCRSWNERAVRAAPDFQDEEGHCGVDRKLIGSLRRVYLHQGRNVCVTVRIHVQAVFVSVIRIFKGCVSVYSSHFKPD